MSSNATTPGQARYILPADLDLALHALAEADLLRLSAATAAELKQRGLSPSAARPAGAPSAARQASAKRPASILPPARVRAIRAAISAGVKPAVVARQFGVSPSAIKSALEE